MGQYRQWLYHREVDQQLRAKLATLEQELRSVHEQAALFEDAASWIDNPIIQAIAMQQSNEALLAASAPDPYPMPPASFAHPTSSEQPTQTVSAALFAWSHLPNLDTEEIRLQDALAATHKEPQPLPHSLADANLLPKDIASFIETHTQAMPQLSTPPLISTITPTSITAALESKTAPDDRTDRSIERWIARWGHKPPATPHLTHNQQQLQEETGP